MDQISISLSFKKICFWLPSDIVSWLFGLTNVRLSGRFEVAGTFFRWTVIDCLLRRLFNWSPYSRCLIRISETAFSWWRITVIINNVYLLLNFRLFFLCFFAISFNRLLHRIIKCFLYLCWVRVINPLFCWLLCWLWIRLNFLSFKQTFSFWWKWIFVILIGICFDCRVGPVSLGLNIIFGRMF